MHQPARKYGMLFFRQNWNQALAIPTSFAGEQRGNAKQAFALVL